MKKVVEMKAEFKSCSWNQVKIPWSAHGQPPRSKSVVDGQNSINLLCVGRSLDPDICQSDHQT